jgi:hypothetical protein
MQNAFVIKFFRKGLLKYFSLENSGCIRVNNATKTLMLKSGNLWLRRYHAISVCKVMEANFRTTDQS